MAERLVARLDLQLRSEFQPEMALGYRRTDPWLPPPVLEWLPFAHRFGPPPTESALTDEQRGAMQMLTGSGGNPAARFAAT